MLQLRLMRCSLPSRSNKHRQRLTGPIQQGEMCRQHLQRLRRRVPSKSHKIRQAKQRRPSSPQQEKISCQKNFSKKASLLKKRRAQLFLTNSRASKPLKNRFGKAGENSKST